jgi:hypothetical protein
MAISDLPIIRKGKMPPLATTAPLSLRQVGLKMLYFAAALSAPDG